MTGPLLAADLVTLAGRGWSRAAAQHVLIGHFIRRPHLTAQTSKELHGWALRLRDVFTAAGVSARCEHINAVLADGAARTSLSMHDGLRPHLHFAADTDDVLARVKAVTAGGLAIFTVESEGTRLGMCQRDGCPVAFVDTSRNGRRAYCTTTCGNYVAVRRHRTARPSATP